MAELADAPDLSSARHAGVLRTAYNQVFYNIRQKNSVRFLYKIRRNFFMPRGIQLKKQTTAQFTLSEALDAFTRHNAVKNLSHRTIRNYEQIIINFMKWCPENKISKVTIETVEFYIMYLQNQNISQQYITSKVRNLRTFLYFCMKREYLSTFKIPLPKADEVIKEPYAEAELEKLMRKPITTNFVELRCWPMSNFFLGTGCRISTALSIKLYNIDFKNRIIKLEKLKNRKQQYIPLSSKLSSILKDYLSYWDSSQDDYLFPNGYSGEQVALRSAQQALAAYNRSKGVTKTGSHRYRHIYAKLYIMNGGGAFQCTTPAWTFHS